MVETDVLVVGAGPTGLTLASALRRHGVQCHVIDKLATPPALAKATAIMPCSLEVLDDLGCVAPFLEQGIRTSRIRTLFAGSEEPVLDMGFDEAGTAYPFITCQEQDRTERFLGAHLEALGGTVHRPVELVSLSRHPDRVEAVLAGKTPQMCHARYVVGCDGAHSTVRHLLNLAFEGSAYPEQFVLGHGRYEWDRSRDGVYTFLSEAGCAYANPLPDDTWLAVADLAGEQQELVHDGDPTAEELTRIFAERMPGPVRVSDLRWSAFFRIHHRQVDRYQDGRVFVAGDAAHIHSPFGGQGMNTGIQDAYNLAWKLALVLRGGASESLLQSYDSERRPVGKAVLRLTHQLQFSSSLRGATTQTVRDLALRCLSHVEAVGHHMADQLGETLYTYHGGPLAHEDWDAGLHLHVDARHPSFRDCRAFSAGAHAGARAPDAALASGRLFDLLRGPHFSLLLFEGTHGSEQEHTDLAALGRELVERLPVPTRCFTIHAGEAVGEGAVADPQQEAHDRYGARGQCLVFVRPDGYIGYRSQPVSPDGLLHYVNKKLGVG